MNAIGLIETYGFVGAVEGLDVALKSANVKLLGCEFVKGGIVTIKISGDVAAVKAAVEAAAAAVHELGTLRNVHVIAKTTPEVWNMIDDRDKYKSCDKSKEQKELVSSHNTEKIVEEVEAKNNVVHIEHIEAKIEITNEETNDLTHTNDENPIEQEVDTEVLVDDKITECKEEDVQDKDEDNKEEKDNKGSNIQVMTQEELESMKVQELRTLARQMELTSLTKKQIKFSKKEQLITAILDHWKRG